MLQMIYLINIMQIEKGPFGPNRWRHQGALGFPAETSCKQQDGQKGWLLGRLALSTLKTQATTEVPFAVARRHLDANLLAKLHLQQNHIRFWRALMTSLHQEANQQWLCNPIPALVRYCNTCGMHQNCQLKQVIISADAASWQ